MVLSHQTLRLLPIFRTLVFTGTLCGLAACGGGGSVGANGVDANTANLTVPAQVQIVTTTN